MDDGIGFVGENYFYPQIFSHTTLFLPHIFYDENIFLYSPNIFRWTGLSCRIGGIVNDKENVAIASKEQQLLRDMLRVPDSKGLTVWSDKQAH